MAPPPPGAGGCAGAWSATTVYTGGNVASYNGHNWTAQYWTEGNAPGSSGSPWTDDGPCGGSSAPPNTPPTTAAPTTAPPSGNPVVNGGFETGALSPWTCTGTAAVVGTPVHSGSHALEGTPSSSADAQCGETVTVLPSHTYTLSGWVDGTYVYLGVSGTGTTDTSTRTPGATGYQSLSDSFTTGASTTSVTVYVHGWYGQPAYHADDIAVN